MRRLVLWAIPLLLVGVSAIFICQRFRIEALPAVHASVPASPLPQYIQLPASEASVFKQWMAAGQRESITGWDPRPVDIHALLEHLEQIKNMSANNWPRGPHIQNPESYSLQFLGIEHNGRKLIYVNALCERLPEEEVEWKKHLAIVMDGGTCFWHASYDPASASFIDLEINGTA